MAYSASPSSLEGPLPRASSEGSVLAAAAVEDGRSTAGSSGLEVQKVECECCGLSEECTLGYIARVKEIFCSHWVCGLCAEAVEEEKHRMGRGTAMEEALRAHMTLCVQFNKHPRISPAVYLADAMRQMLRRNLEGRSPIARSKPASRASPRSNLTRSSSCLPTIPSECMS